MAEPEATVYEDCLPPNSEKDVGLSRKVLAMQPITITQTMKQIPHDKLGLGMLRADPEHQPTAAIGRSVIHHRSNIEPCDGDSKAVRSLEL